MTALRALYLQENDLSVVDYSMFQGLAGLELLQLAGAPSLPLHTPEPHLNPP